ncbi:hypothetical protein KC19_9G075500 [Ceratodon purpureus]|uniref:Protein kinase domain-containing protein n=1 Tax=Ceratodon purpureus TaxID=3225 RepID=A0A8T0GXE8_CERPU|nr:hypothetical protein KC19_9G075500 [Ceratodon purpureus]
MHRDIKAKNILLDRNYEAKIADFGLALLFSDGQTHITTDHVAGTKGYLAPEYALLGQMSDKVDVFSFGVLCLEVVSSRRNMDERLRPDMVYLVKWAWKLHGQGRLLDLVCPTLSLQDDEKPQVQRLINTALLCIQHTGEQKPSIARVVSMLQGDADLEVVVNPGAEDQYHQMDSARLLDLGNSAVSRVNDVSEEGPFWKSIRRDEGRRSSRTSESRSHRASEATVEGISSNGMITVSEIRGR